MTLPSGVIWRHFQLEIGLAERDRGGAARGRDLVRKLFTLLDDRLDLVGRDDARAGHDFALAVGLEGRKLKVQEAIGRRAEQRQRHLRRSAAAEAVGRHIGRQVDEARVVVAGGNALVGLATDTVVVAADGHVIAAADAVARNAALLAPQIACTKLDTERTAELVVGFNDPGLDQHLPDRHVDLRDHGLDLLQLARDVRHKKLVGASLRDDAASRRQDAGPAAARSTAAP